MPGKEILYAVNEARHSYSDEELKKTKVTFHGLRVIGNVLLIGG